MLLSPFYAATVRRESLSGCLIFFFIRVRIAIYLVDKTTYRTFQVPGTNIRISRVTREYYPFCPH